MIKLKKLLNEQVETTREFLDKYYQTGHPMDDFMDMVNNNMSGKIMTPIRRNMSTINVNDANRIPAAFGQGFDVKVGDHEIIFLSEYALPPEAIESFDSVGLALAIRKTNDTFEKLYSMYLLNELPNSFGVSRLDSSDQYEIGRLQFKLTDYLETSINGESVQGFRGDFELDGKPFYISVYFPIG
jgi:hypothetical protein